MSWYKFMELTIRRERESDLREISELIRSCFKNEDTGLLVRMLRTRKEFIKDLSRVSEINGILTGYILLNPIHIQTSEALVKTLWLEPVCVHPNFQKKGIGTALIKDAVHKATDLGFESIFVTGNFSYYSRFGFRRAGEFGIDSSLNIPSEAFLAMELKQNGLPKEGKLMYPQEIFD